MVLSVILCVLPLAALTACCVLFVRGCSPGFALLALLAGVVSVIPIAALQLVVFPAFSSLDFRLTTRLVFALVFNGLIEESIKFLCLLGIPRKGRPFGAIMAAGALAGFTVGSLEAVMYFASGVGRIALRLATAGLIHTFCALLSSVCIASFSSGKKYWQPFALAVLIHGVYNFFAGFPGRFWWFSVAAIFFAAIECRMWYVKTAG
jgi:hypothetical protein